MWLLLFLGGCFTKGIQEGKRQKFGQYFSLVHLVDMHSYSSSVFKQGSRCLGMIGKLSRNLAVDRDSLGLHRGHL